MTLEQELKTYGERLSELLESEGKYAVIVGTDLIGVFADYGDALDAGYKKVGGNKPFLVKRIARFEPPMHLRCAVA